MGLLFASTTGFTKSNHIKTTKTSSKPHKSSLRHATAQKKQLKPNHKGGARKSKQNKRARRFSKKKPKKSRKLKYEKSRKSL